MKAQVQKNKQDKPELLILAETSEEEEKLAEFIEMLRDPKTNFAFKTRETTRAGCSNPNKKKSFDALRFVWPPPDNKSTAKLAEDVKKTFTKKNGDKENAA